MNSVRAGIVSACLCLVSLAGSAQPSVGADAAPAVNAIWVE